MLLADCVIIQECLVNAPNRLCNESRSVWPMLLADCVIIQECLVNAPSRLCNEFKSVWPMLLADYVMNPGVSGECS